MYTGTLEVRQQSIFAEISSVIENVVLVTANQYRCHLLYRTLITWKRPLIPEKWRMFPITKCHT